MVNQSFWNGKKVFITGNTGFKGSWLSLWLAQMGVKTYGYALKPPTEPSLYELGRLDRLVDTTIGDIRDIGLLQQTMKRIQPEIVFHMAAQPLVRDSYKDPVATYSINVMGTVNLLETVRSCSSVRSVVNVTTDKVYENNEWYWGYRENEPMGGYDPYSNSKACSELVTSAFRSSFFNPNEYSKHNVALASARAGNVIGGGDWAADRLVPDIVSALLNGKQVQIRNPLAIRPWQHVLEPLGGYLLLAQKLYEEGSLYAEGWNFGPNDEDAKPVQWIVKRLCELWGDGDGYQIDQGMHPHEANYLKLDCSKAKQRLNWQPRWDLDRSLKMIVEWTIAYKNNQDLQAICLKQIDAYLQS